MGRPPKKAGRSSVDFLSVSFCALSIVSFICIAQYALRPHEAAVRAPRTHLVPPLWQKLGANDPDDIAEIARTVPRRRVFEALAEEYLAPWSAAHESGMKAAISAKLLDSMEVPLRWYSVGRIRLSGINSILYRVLHHWEKTYRLPRFVFFLDLLTRVMERYPALTQLSTELYVNTADGPRATVDSASGVFAGLPVFSFRTERGHIDIPLPDPVEHGSHVTGEGYMLGSQTLDAAPKWSERKDTLIFRGASSSIPGMHSGNWFLSPRVRVAQISKRYPTLIDAGITNWMKLGENTTADEIMDSVGLYSVPPLTLPEQLHYKYVLDVDGGLGSSRKRWMLLSGSVSFFQTSTVYQWYEPLLVPWVHYVPVDKWFRNLVRHVQWARANDDHARRITVAAREFAEKFLSDDAILEYMAVLLQHYAPLSRGVRRWAQPVANPCTEAPDVANGPMGCRTDWYVYEPNDTFPFWCRHRPMEYLNFVCRRKSPITGRKEVKHGLQTPYDNDYDRIWRVKREKELEAEKLAKRAAMAAAQTQTQVQV